MTDTEARAALEAVDEVEARAGGKRRVPWAVITLVSAATGAAAGLSLHHQLAGLLLIAGICLLILAVELRRPHAVRPAVKQDVAPDPEMSWRTSLPVLVFVPTFILLPHDNVAVSVCTGALVALGTGLLLAQEWRGQ